MWGVAMPGYWVVGTGALKKTKNPYHSLFFLPGMDKTSCPRRRLSFIFSLHLWYLSSFNLFFSFQRPPPPPPPPPPPSICYTCSDGATTLNKAFTRIWILMMMMMTMMMMMMICFRKMKEQRTYVSFISSHNQ